MRKACVWTAGALVALAACSGGDGGGGTTNPAVFTTLDVQPATVNVTVNGTQPLTASAKDQNGATMSGLTVAYVSSATARATVSPAGVVTGVSVGTATITATGTVGTVTKTKDVAVTVANQTVPGLTANVAATGGSTFDPSNVTILATGTVTWSFAIEHNVTWDAAAPTGGNIPNTSTGTVQRTFPTAGTYNYRCTLHAGMTGRVTVQ
jgi:plastocyanin